MSPQETGRSTQAEPGARQQTRAELLLDFTRDLIRGESGQRASLAEEPNYSPWLERAKPEDRKELTLNLRAATLLFIATPKVQTPSAEQLREMWNQVEAELRNKGIEPPSL